MRKKDANLVTCCCLLALSVWIAFMTDYKELKSITTLFFSVLANLWTIWNYLIPEHYCFLLAQNIFIREENGYTVSIDHKEHKLGEHPSVKVYMKIGEVFSEVDVTVIISPKGDVQIHCVNPFEGKAVLL